MQRQRQSNPALSQTFRAQAISDISVPEVNIEMKALNPAVASEYIGGSWEFKR